MSPNPKDLLVLDRGHNTTCTIHLHGATVLSWILKGEEKIFLSPKAVFDNKKAIRGGIPVVFPCFGPWELGPAHGFARISRWEVIQEPKKTEAGDIRAILVLTDSESSRKLWNYSFRLTYTVTLAENSLVTDFSVTNKSSESFDFTCLLHTYFRVDDINTVSVSGLKGLKYADKVRDGNLFSEDREVVTIRENVDRVYIATENTHLISNTLDGKTLTISKSNFPDTVVWNPWKAKAAAMPDLGEESYPNMVCVEAGHVSSPVNLSAGATYNASQTLQA
ncbi:hypothetical protein CAPTEDRAFT_152132 [Capitella teleta]|uniref:glucose-6-phosphate 1-epimerase n=1 Tax=Capitella teleta TaxID=283909 RepID=R7V012_CAPTE|nr:hypothetical protein CAPTEDRAFT_152132 [Capitella teleta]|eukprot:ELU11889.1 hypothetical protein CAPTEDRAFT_152132 [Capitella teleta]